MIIVIHRNVNCVLNMEDVIYEVCMCKCEIYLMEMYMVLL